MWTVRYGATTRSSLSTIGRPKVDVGRHLPSRAAIRSCGHAGEAATLLFGLGRLVRHDRRREIVIALLALVWIFNVLGLVVLVVSLVAHSGVEITGRQLLFGGGAVWFTSAVAFGLAFWELDCGGPLARALATGPRARAPVGAVGGQCLEVVSGRRPGKQAAGERLPIKASRHVRAARDDERTILRHRLDRFCVKPSCNRDARARASRPNRPGGGWPHATAPDRA